MNKTAVIFIHCRHVGAGAVPAILEGAGFSVKTYLTPEEDFSDENADLLVVMGGPQGAYESDKYPYLQQEMNIIAARLHGDRPTLGICLGSQLMAKARGANVYKGKQGPEIGWLDIAVHAGQNGPLRHLDAVHTKIMQWHGDTFDLPEGAALLASSGLYKNQAFSYGNNALAIQAHPEVDEKLALQWIEKMDASEVMRTGETLEQAQNRLRAETKIFSDKLVRQMRLFMQEWLKNTGLI